MSLSAFWKEVSQMPFSTFTLTIKLDQGKPVAVQYSGQEAFSQKQHELLHSFIRDLSALPRKRQRGVSAAAFGTMLSSSGNAPISGAKSKDALLKSQG